MGNIFSIAYPINKPDYRPEQNVYGSQKVQVQTRKTTEQINFLNSHVKSSEILRKRMRIVRIQTCLSNVLVLYGNGNLSKKLLSYSDIYLSEVYFEDRISLRFTENQFRLLIRDKSFLLPTFEMLLNGDMSEGDFKEDLLRDFPSEYNDIWSVLTSKGNFEAHYYYDSRTKEIDETDYLTKFDLFQQLGRSLRLRRNPYSGELIAHVLGQVIPQIPFEGANWSLKSVSFLNDTSTTATIDFSLLKSCFVLHLDGKSYDLPNYVEALSGTITQIEFKNRLRRENQQDFDRVWAFLVEREKRHLAFYTRKW
jgi:hypothetical protein